MLRDAAIQVPQSVQDKINAVTDVLDIRQVAINAMAEAGLIVRTRGDDLNYRLNPDAVGRPAASSLSDARPVQEPTCCRVLYLHGNDRLEIYGLSENELDQKERQLRAMYGGQR
jgi:hypothetical protein